MSAIVSSPVSSPASVRDSVSAAEWQARVELAACHRLMAAAGVDDLTYNHLSARVPGEPGHYLIKDERQFFDEVTASSLLKYDFDGNKLSHNPGTVSRGGHAIHAGVLKARPDLAAVFHTHTTANIAVSSQKFGLLPLSQHAFRVRGRLGYHAFGGFEFSPEHTERLVLSLTGWQFLLLRNHGALITGTSIAEAYVEHHNVEFACRAQVAALSAGYENIVLPDEEVAAYTDKQVATFLTGITADGKDWGALLRQAERKFPDYQL